MLDTIWDQVLTELHKGASQQKHPFRYTYFTTVDEYHQPFSRTVVLRRVWDDSPRLWIYTDERTPKVAHLQSNPKVSLLFYHPKQLLQVSIRGKCRVIKDEEIVQTYWNGVRQRSQNDYTTNVAPGTSIANPDHVSYDYDQPHFCILEVRPQEIEYLQLKRPNHIRALFTQKDSDEWDQTFLVP